MLAVRIWVAIFGLALAGVAAVFALNEYRAFLQWDVPTSDMVAGISPDGFVWAPARSVRTEDDEMAACIRAYQSLMYRFAGDGQKQALSKACFERASAILDRSPSRSVAHLARAISAEELGDRPTALEGLRLSAATGAQLGWLAYRRARFGLDLVEANSGDAMDGGPVLPLIESDIAVLASEPRLTAALAGLYVLYEEHQDWIGAQVGKLPAEVQNRFLAEVRAAMQPSAGS